MNITNCDLVILQITLHRLLAILWAVTYSNRLIRPLLLPPITVQGAIRFQEQSSLTILLDITTPPELMLFPESRVERL